ncbi:MAG TPA: amidohydrolase [Longimicrobiales bacterium]
MSDRLSGCAVLTIVAAATSLLGPAPVPAQTPDLVLTGGKVFTADSARPWAQAIAIRGERIIAVGSDADVAKLAARTTRRVELGGRVVVPGFNDAHAHLGCHAASSPNPAAITLASISEDPFADPPFATVADSLRALAARLPAGHWIGATIGPSLLEDSAARRAALDRIAAEHPVWLGAWTGHGAILNTLALRALGIDDTAADPPGGRYEREAGSRRLTGLLEEYAVMQARRRLCSMQPESVLVASLREEGQQFPRFGITSVQNIAGELEPALFMRLARAAELPVRLRMISLPIASSADNAPGDWRAERLPGAPARNAAGGTIAASGVKWILDGTPIERLAAHRRAYRDRPGYFGRLNFPPDTIRALLLDARARREQPLLHAGGDSTLVVVLDLMERSGGPGWRTMRVRLEHGDGLAPDLLARARPLGVVLVQNPSHLATPVFSDRFEPDVLAGFLPLRSAIAAGVPLAFGSDGPVNPFLNILFATTHPARPEESLTREQAVMAYTRGSAYAEFAENEKGTLAPGMLADLAVLSQDIFLIPAPALPATTSVLTVIGGRIVFDALTGTRVH